MRFISFMTLSVVMCGIALYADNVAPSTNPPGGLQASQVPQFVVIGFDDNTISDGINWALDFLRSKKNPAGNGNTATYDGSNVRVSFYCNTVGLSTWYEDDPAQLKTAIEKIYSDGHEIGNHTLDHHGKLNESLNYDWDKLVEALNNYSIAQWETSIRTMTDTLTAFTNIPVSAVIGFRTPYLQYKNNSFAAVKNLQYTYDCSIEEGAATQFNGTNFRWPYTLDSGSPGHEESYYGTVIGPLSARPGLWEVPNHMVMVPADAECPSYGIPAGLRAKIKSSITWFEDRLTGFDYNLWYKKSGEGAILKKAEMLAILKYNLDKRYNGNRAPFMFGAHSQYYIGDWADSNSTETAANMRAAIEEFISYALSKPDVRIVPAKKIIEWCRAPKALNDINTVDTTNPSDNLIELAGWEASADEFGSTVDTGTAIITGGVMKAGFKQIAQPDTSTWPWVSVTAYLDENSKLDNVKWIKVSYKCDKNMIVSLPQPPLSDEGSSYQITVPSSGSWRTELLKIADFKQPSWVETSTPLDLSLIKSVSFNPSLDDVAGGSATIEINQVVLYGYQDPTQVIVPALKSGASGLTINKVTPVSIALSVPTKGTYSLSIFTVDGRMVKSLGQHVLRRGHQSISWNGSEMGKQVYFICLEGAAGRSITKTIIQ